MWPRLVNIQANSSWLTSCCQFWQPYWHWKHRKNCKCCPGHSLTVSHEPSRSGCQFLNLSRIVNCVNDYGQPDSKISVFWQLSEGRFHEKKLLFFWILSKWGGGVLPNFFATFLWVQFWSIKGVYFLQNDNNFNFKLFLGCSHDPQSKYSAFIQEEFWIMSHFECSLNRRFWR